MLIVKKPNEKFLKEAARQVKRGAVVVYPTDTAYALGCDATNAKAVENIFKLKGRDAAKALPIICADAKMAKKFFVLATRHSQLATRHWPGPLSIVVEAKKGIAEKALLKGTAAVRVPDSRIARTLAKFLGRPLIATSANVSNRPPCYSVIAFMRQFSADPFPALGQAAIAIDAGALRRRRPSTIVKIGDDGQVEVLRKGPIKFDIRHSSFPPKADQPRADNIHP